MQTVCQWTQRALCIYHLKMGILPFANFGLCFKKRFSPYLSTVIKLSPFLSIYRTTTERLADCC